jgi:hypothetical protein
MLIPGVKLLKLEEEVEVDLPKEKKIIPTIELSTFPPSLQFEKNHILSFTYPSNFNSVILMLIDIPQTAQCNLPIGELKFKYFEILIENPGELKFENNLLKIKVKLQLD